jgi:HAMP domain-containing protein
MTVEPRDRDIGLMGKIGRNFVLLIVVLGLGVGVIVYDVAGRILYERHNQLTALVTTNLSDAATTHVVSKDILQLKTLVTKYARLDGVAYVFITDREGNVIAHSLSTFSPELMDGLTFDQRRQISRRIVTLQGKKIHETRGPILEGRLGTAHLGIWAEASEKEIFQALFLLLWPPAALFLAAIMVAVYLARRLTRPFRRLAQIAGRISTGDLDTPVRTDSDNEFGELTRSLERMRASLKAAMLRLGQS